MNDVPDHTTSIEHERELILAGQQEAAKLIGATTRPRSLLGAIAGYEVVREIGRGGMGVVYEAEQQNPRRRVALKVLRSLLADEHHVKLFRREVQTLARLNHPSIATIYEAGQTDDGQHFFTMELVAGVPLNVYVCEHELPLRGRLGLFIQICEAVEFAHAHGVIHRDLKPSNIAIDVDGNPKILDFGLARITDADVTVTATVRETGHIMGTLGYMSPEQARGNPAEIDPRSDVYALGVILYEVLTSRLPYELEKGSPAEALRMICEKSPGRPSHALGWDGRPARHLRGDLETIVLKALEKEPSRRYQSAAELAEDIRRYLAGDPIRAKPPSRLYILKKRAAKHRRAVALTAAAVALALLGTWGAMRWSRHATEQQRARDRATTRRQLLSIQNKVERGEAAQMAGRAEVLHSQYPELPEGVLVLARAALARPELAGRDYAIAELRSELQRDPSRGDCAALLAEMCRDMDDPAQAAGWEARAQQHAPDTAEAWYVRSFATLNTEEALRCAREALSRDRKHELAWERLAGLCLLRENLDEAVEAADALLAMGADPLNWQAFRSHVLIGQGRLEEAIRQYDVLVRDDRPGMYAQRAHVYRRLRRYAEAVRDYSKALELVQASGEPRVWLRYQRATPLWILGRTEEAAEDYRAVRAGLGRPFHCDARLSIILRDGGRQREAEEVLSRALKDVADNDPWLKEVFDCLAGGLAPDDLIRDALGRDNRKHVCEAYYYAGEFYRLAGQPERAQECFAKCVQTGVQSDPDTLSPAPMNEYELAQWRLDQLASREDAATNGD